jgi:glucose/arabinose dehydrogenase
MRRLAAALAAVVVIAGCTSDDPEPASRATTTTATTAPTGTTVPLAEGTLDSIGLTTEEVAVLDAPIAMAARPGSADLYIAEKAGRVRLVEVDVQESFDDSPDETTYDLQSTPLLDISDDVIDGEERGLLGMAFSTDGRKLYLDYTRQPDGYTVVVEYQLGDRATIDEDSRRELLVVEQPFANHNGGQLAIGPDGFLYIGLGDGGDTGDPFGNGQSTEALLGKILRIDPEAPTEDGLGYAIPPGNPYADSQGGVPEVWLYGVRNPWRFTFDAATGDLWVADVGQNAYEEVNRLPATGGFDAGKDANLGWAEMEASHPYDGGENPPGAVLPIYEYSHDAGCAITGGYVYRGEQIPSLQGVYLFADYCSAGIRGLQLDQGTVIDDRTWDLPVQQVQSFGQDDDGELYLLLASGPVLKLAAA